MTLDLSLGEFAALVAKALRGAGYAWGLADDGAYAARTLARHRVDAGAVIARLVSVVDQHGEMVSGSCPIQLGAALSDLGEVAAAESGRLFGEQMVHEPVLLAPWLPGHVVRWEGGHVTISGHGVIIVEGDLTSAAKVSVDRLALDQVFHSSATRDLATRAAVAKRDYDTLIDFAARTYAPATEASRIAGAGEGA